MTKEEKTVALLTRMIELWMKIPLTKSELGDLAHLPADGTSFKYNNRDYALEWEGTDDPSPRASVVLSYKINKDDNKANAITLVTLSNKVSCPQLPYYINTKEWIPRNEYSLLMERSVRKSFGFRQFISFLKTDEHYAYSKDEEELAYKAMVRHTEREEVNE